MLPKFVGAELGIQKPIIPAKQRKAIPALDRPNLTEE
jgi:hypothetical protein